MKHSEAGPDNPCRPRARLGLAAPLCHTRGLTRLALLVALALLAGGAVSADRATAQAVQAPARTLTRVLPTPGSPQWRPVHFPKIGKHTRYEVVSLSLEPGGDPQPVFHANADCSASGMALSLGDIDLARTPVLHWWWKLSGGLQIENERSKAGDDFAARVYLLFRFEPERASFARRIAQRLGSRLAGQELPGSVLSYVWASHAAAGESWPNPYAPRTRMLALRSGPAPAAVRPAGPASEGGRWESVDLLADQRRLAGPQAETQLMALAVMSDADNSCQRAEAYYGGFRFSSAAAGGDAPSVGDPP